RSRSFSRRWRDRVAALADHPHLLFSRLSQSLFRDVGVGVFVLHLPSRRPPDHQSRLALDPRLVVNARARALGRRVAAVKTGGAELVLTAVHGAHHALDREIAERI